MTRSSIIHSSNLVIIQQSHRGARRVRNRVCKNIIAKNKCAETRVAEQCWARSRSRPVPGCQIEFTSKLDSDQLLPQPGLSQQPDTRRCEELWSEHGEEAERTWARVEARFFFICKSAGRVNKSDLVFNLTRRVENLPVLYFISSSKSPITKQHIASENKN